MGWEKKKIIVPWGNIFVVIDVDCQYGMDLICSLSHDCPSFPSVFSFVFVDRVVNFCCLSLLVFTFYA